MVNSRRTLTATRPASAQRTTQGHPGRWRWIALAAMAAAAGLSGLIYADYRREIGQAWQAVSSASRIAQTACGPVEYAVEGSGPAVLVVHGAGGGYDQGMEFARPLAARGFQIIAVSRFGYLRTPLPTDASAAAQADAHACLLDALGIRQAAVVGASAGAPSSLQFALRHPEKVRSLILLVPGTYVPRLGNAPSMHTPPRVGLLSDTVLRSDFLLWAAIKLMPDTLIPTILATPLSDVRQANDAEQARVHKMLDQILPVSPRRLGLMNDARVTGSLPRYDLEKILAPTLAISVADDLYGTFDGARYSAEHIPNARFVGYATGGHLWVGHQEQVISEIAAFLQ